MNFSEWFAHIVGGIIGLVIGGVIGFFGGILATWALVCFSVWTNPDKPDAASIGIMVIAFAPCGGILGAIAGAIIARKCVWALCERDDLLRNPPPKNPPSSYWPPYPTTRPSDSPEKSSPPD